MKELLLPFVFNEVQIYKGGIKDIKKMIKNIGGFSDYCFRLNRR
ncbi:hypothetical protein P278_29890 [Zhouia amylolytica AD3]|uniref:Uncharacterized protein n=1 Tax=Zhouia amylolytica AD3 TaxID=1286632 RepID=W2UJ56_9FLAO|nr:hypothetical protein P278_29890 [Zhouia amylolytica AD3]